MMVMSIFYFLISDRRVSRLKIIELKKKIRKVFYPVTEIVGEDEITSERIGKGVVKVEHLDEFVSFDGVQVAIGERPNVSRRLPHRSFFPKCVAKDVSFPCNAHKYDVKVIF
jgi:hypothetical protein